MHQETHPDHPHDRGPHAHGHEPAHEHGHDHEHHHGHHHHEHAHHEHAHGPQPRAGGRFGRALGAIVAIAVGGLVAYSICFFVDETEYVYVTEFGKPVWFHAEPGLKFKLPYQSVRRLDRRLQMHNPPGSQMLTRDRPGVSGEPSGAGSRERSLGGPPLSVEWYVCWRLPSEEFARQAGSDLKSLVLRFLESVDGSIDATHDRLRERIDSMLKAKVGRTSLAQFVSLTERIELDRLTRELTDETRQMALDQFGIEIVDVRVKRFNHPEGVKPAIFEMIRAERQGVADKYRAEGKSEAAMTRSLADKQYSQIVSKAQAEAERIRGRGDAEAMQIANEAHRQDPKFYQFLKTLETYRAILNDRTTVVLSSDSSLLKLLTDGMPNLPPAPPGRQAGPSSDGTTAPPGTAGNGTQEKRP